jgi:hypothetical protein
VLKQPDQEINYGTAAPVATQSIADAKEPLRIRWFASSYIDLPVQGLPPVAAAGALDVTSRALPAARTVATRPWFRRLITPQ